MFLWYILVCFHSGFFVIYQRLRANLILCISTRLSNLSTCFILNLTQTHHHQHAVADAPGQLNKPQLFALESWPLTNQHRTVKETSNLPNKPLLEQNIKATIFNMTEIKCTKIPYAEWNTPVVVIHLHTCVHMYAFRAGLTGVVFKAMCLNLFQVLSLEEIKLKISWDHCRSYYY